MDFKLKQDKKTGTFKLDKLPEGCAMVIICAVKVEGLVPLKVELASNVKVDYIKELLEDPENSQVTLIPVNYNNYINVTKEWKNL